MGRSRKHRTHAQKLQQRQDLERQQTSSGRLHARRVTVFPDADPAVADKSPSPEPDADYSPAKTILEEDDQEDDQEKPAVADDQEDDYDFEEDDYDDEGDEPSSSACNRQPSLSPLPRRYKQQPRKSRENREPAVAEYIHNAIDAGRWRDKRFHKSGLAEDRDLPQWIGMGQCLLSTWILGQGAEIDTVRKAIMKAPFDCIVLMCSRAVEAGDRIAAWMTVTAERDQSCSRKKRFPKDSFLAERALFKVWDGCFIAINRNKVTECELNFWTPDEDEYIPQSHVTRSSGVQLATVKLTFNVRRQNMPTMNLGILRVLSQHLSNQDVKDLIEWIIRSQVAVVTGYFGTDSPQLRRVAIASRATWAEPAAQWMLLPPDWKLQRRTRRVVTHPSFYMFFGDFRDFKLAENTPVPPWWPKFGDDLENELIDVTEFPTWPMNREGSPRVKHLGLIKTKPIDFKKERWTPCVLQTCIWLGTSQPAWSSFKNTFRRTGYAGPRRENYMPGEGKGKGKGNRKRKGEGRREDKKRRKIRSGGRQERQG